MGSGGSTLATTKYVEKHKHLKEGDRVPDVPLKFRVIDPSTPSPDPRQLNFVWKDIMVSELLAGKRVVIFGVPGGMQSSLWPCIAAHGLIINNVVWSS